ncbi:MarR family winged helix-turn-helix transcriptional regulator [Salimicrobium halophilum]|uniref:DNA-binding transcriptional regulator, MarR family n=1 Tax=Salimicrobium halophilum TaxID=86666 RepID=A0A1G8T8M4_9BACI|nr:MarR family transcriptional regulator [Salimicrobium halophilum]SDJ37794.1 DNA-binding transcriptional regulator, MarR family [Salimicrobium halophilum]
MNSDNELVDRILSVLPALPKKLFGDIQPFQESDLHPTHVHILHIIEQEGAVPMKTIAQKLAINKSNLTPLVRKLIDYGLLEKTKWSEDRRVTLVQLTGDGSSFLGDKKKHMEDKLRERLDTLSAEDRQTLHDTFSQLSVILDKMNR